MDKTDYELLNRQAEELKKGSTKLISVLANLSALIFHSIEKINWAGFYLCEGEKLLLGPFQGKVACVEIPFGRGVCGTAAAEDRTLLIDDVHSFKGHIACDGDSRSEIVVPIHADEKVIGVLDIDSPVLSRFSSEDRRGLEELVRRLEGFFGQERRKIDLL